MRTTIALIFSCFIASQAASQDRVLMQLDSEHEQWKEHLRLQYRQNVITPAQYNEQLRLLEQSISSRKLARQAELEKEAAAERRHQETLDAIRGCVRHNNGALHCDRGGVTIIGR